MLINNDFIKIGVDTTVEKYGAISRRTSQIYNYLGLRLFISLTMNNEKKYINSHEMNIIQVLLQAFIKKEIKK